ncbi:hypothetical protein BBD42_23550 [Paenibacillus sp. BIHB 4019]|uniref:Copper amine oxidase-like N-terminal domain-containing protein n=1 Tax=Paenibacillus sp. BIHB 4019 TaxID=1870819 RepID=A0A1B2DTA4_9BACL|nr:hypothetical protein BBD42_23550 [Paenibacillus sp. BIHB 4019]
MNHGIKFILNGESWNPKDSNGAAVKPISYAGTTYVPLRSVAEATGAEIKWDNDTQSISISTGDQEATRQPFNTSNVSHVKTYTESGITNNVDELLFGETQYTSAFVVQGVNSANQGVTFKIKEGTKKIGISIGFKDPKGTNATYSIGTKTSTFATGSVNNGTVVTNTLDIPKGTTELILEFKGQPGANGKGYLLWDESWLEK